MVGARIKIWWEEQLVDPSNEYLTPVNIKDLPVLVATLKKKKKKGGTGENTPVANQSS